MSEIIIDKNAKQITFTNNGIGFSQFGIATEILDLIENQTKEIERLNNIIKRLEEFIEKEIELYTLELTEKNTNALSYSLPIRGVYKEIYNVLQELKGSDKE